MVKKRSKPLTQGQLAKLSDMAYQDYNATRREWLRQTDKNLRLDAGLSNKYMSVVRDIGSNDVFISHRGTKLTDIDDLSADLSIISGKEKMNKRFLESEKHYEKVREKYGQNANIILTGHSLGGTVSRHLSNKYGLEAHIFNPGSAIGHVRDSLKYDEDAPRGDITVYQVRDDPISILGRLGHDKLVDVEQTEKSPHSLKNFLD